MESALPGNYIALWGYLNGCIPGQFITESAASDVCPICDEVQINSETLFCVVTKVLYTFFNPNPP